MIVSLKHNIICSNKAAILKIQDGRLAAIKKIGNIGFIISD